MSTDTEIKLLAIHRAPAVPLEDICTNYLGLSPTVAKQRAALNTLPFPTFRTTDSAKAPVMVRIADLAAVLDSQFAIAKKSWERAQM